jgi:glutathione S-transferase
VELVADLFPESGLLPKDPVQRAKARFFIDAVSNQFVSKYGAHVMRGESADALVEGAQVLEKLLAGKFALGDKFTAADAALAPFLLRGELVWSFRDPEGVQKQIQDKAPRFWQYFQDLKAHPSVASTWDGVRTSCFQLRCSSTCSDASRTQEAILPYYKERFGGQK